jgi:predicted DNA-binding transcriptional regulator AlpA
MNQVKRNGRFGGVSAVRYFEHEVDHWIKSRIRSNTGRPAAPPPQMPAHPRLIRKKEVENRVGISGVHIWRLEQKGAFPARVLLDSPTAEAANPRRKRPML